MKLHADLKDRAVVFSGELPWVDSPFAGVQRRMLERDGNEIARATSIVRYSANIGLTQPHHMWRNTLNVYTKKKELRKGSIKS